MKHEIGKILETIIIYTLTLSIHKITADDPGFWRGRGGGGISDEQKNGRETMVIGAVANCMRGD